eukprot:544341-Pleurochrysis_carterae.AAC.1
MPPVAVATRQTPIADAAPGRHQCAGEPLAPVGAKAPPKPTRLSTTTAAGLSGSHQREHCVQRSAYCTGQSLYRRSRPRPCTAPPAAWARLRVGTARTSRRSPPRAPAPAPEGGARRALPSARRRSQHPRPRSSSWS